jgi:uncharacterized SAM-binding protein YcdF (DUF218 family)
VFVVSKIFWAIASPSTLIVACVAVGALLLAFRRGSRWGRRLVLLGTAVLVLASIQPIASLPLIALEDRFPLPVALPQHVDGIIVLSGMLQVGVTKARGQVNLNAGADRLTAFMALAHRYPDARLVFTGGSASIVDQSVKEADLARSLLIDMGFPMERVVFEDQSRNTWENALFTHRAIQPGPGETWLLVTSAFHMPRSMGCFRQAGWAIMPYPVDYQTEGLAEWSFDVDPSGGLRNLDWAFHEVVGLVAYRLLGQSNSLWPGPEPARR